jgi:lysophospholipase L1-like esterase
MNPVLQTKAKRHPRFVFRVAAILLGLAPFLLIECGLRLAGVPGGDSDPLSGFNRNLRLFERDGSIYRTAGSREPFFPAQQFPVTKPTNGFRIFCFGGSTVHGHPYQSDTAFPKWLELELNARESKRTFQAINCGGVSYASYRIVPLVEEVTRYQPDLIVVATGENEFLEDRTYRSVKSRSAIRRWFEDGLQSLRIVTVARQWLRPQKAQLSGTSDSTGKEASIQEVRTRLDTSAGYASYHRDDAWHDRVAAQFEESLRTMVETCRAAHVPLLFVKPGSNLRDCPPYKSEHRPGITLEEERTWQSLFDQATAKQNRADALATYRKAEEMDGEYALLLFRIAKLLDAQGERQQTLDYYLKARDQDICPLRPPTRHEQILERVSQETKTPLVDAAALIAAQSMDRSPGNDWYLDHVHPNIGGHQLIARALVERIQQSGLIRDLAAWSDAERQKTYKTHLQSLPNSYFAEGARRVEWLEHWARRERLFDEALPHDPAAFLRAGFRHLELGDEEAAFKELQEAIARDRKLEAEAQHYAERLLSEGRISASARLRDWLSNRDKRADR